MILRSGDEWEFQLNILGYENPEIAEDEVDSNWLIISLRGRVPGGTWQATDPCLLTFEVTKLAAWLETVADVYEPLKLDTLEFQEPILSFEVAARAEEIITLRVTVLLDVRPAWAPGHAGRLETWIELRLSALDLQTAARALLSQLARFPPRGRAPLARSP